MDFLYLQIFSHAVKILNQQIMKKLYTFFAVILLGVVAVAQNSRKAFIPHLSNPQLSDSQMPKLKNRTPIATHALGDTVFVFDGSYYYNWNGTLPSTFAFKLEDIDSYTISAGLQPYFGTKGSFSFFYELNPTSDLLYNHPDTVFHLRIRRITSLKMI